MTISVRESLGAVTRDERLASLRSLVAANAGQILNRPLTDEVNNHVHTNYSFSPYSPAHAAWMARFAGLRAVGSVDHDSIAAADEMIEACRRRGISIAIVNGRIGAGSQRLLGTMRRLLPRLWDAVRICCARSPEDAEGFRQAGVPADRVADCGLLKCDLLAEPPPQERLQELRRLFGISPLEQILVAGSTHPGEEQILTSVYRDLKRTHRRLRLIIAPRHVERAADVVAAVHGRGVPVVAKTQLDSGAVVAPAEAVIVVDTIGDLMACYGLATCAFVGRSLLPPGGGQNVMEPAALGVPVITGPHTLNFGPEMGLLKAARGAVVVRGATELTRAVHWMLSDPATAVHMGQAGRAIVRESQGATDRTLERIGPLLA